MKYSVRITKRADQDIDDLIDYIENNLSAPMTAEKFSRGIYKKIVSLQTQANIYPLSAQESVQKYSLTVRRVNYKGFAIIYTIEDTKVIIHRIIHGSLIT